MATINREIKYVITSENQTEQGLSQAENSSKQTTENIKKNAKEAAQAFGKEFKTQATGLGNAFKTLLKPVELFFDMIKNIAGYIAKLVINFTALAIVGRAVGLAFDTMLGKGNKISGFFNSMATGLQNMIKIWKHYVTTGIIKDLGSAVKNSQTYKLAHDMGVVLGNAFMRGFSKSGGATIPSASTAKNFMGAMYNKNVTAEIGALNRLFGKFGDTGALAMQRVAHSAGVAMNWISSMKQFIATGTKVGNVLLSIGKFLYQNIKLLGILAVSIFAAVTAYKSLNKEIERGNAIGIGAQKLGIAVEKYQALDFMLKQTGSSIEEMDMSFSQLSKKAFEAAKGNDAAAYAFKVLGINAKTSSGSLKNNSVFISEVLTKLSNMKDVALRNALALEIFGKQGRNIIPMLDEYGSSLGDVLAKYEKSSPVLNKFVDNSRRITKTQGEIAEAWDNAKASLFEGTIKRLGDSLVLIMNSGIGEFLFGIGKTLMWLVNMLIDGFNVVLGIITTTTATFMTGIYKIAQGTMWLLSKFGTNPAIKKGFENVKELADKTAKEAAASFEQTLISAKQFASLGLWTGPVKKSSRVTEETPVTPDKVDLSAYELRIKMTEREIKLIQEKIEISKMMYGVYLDNVESSNAKELIMITNNYEEQANVALLALQKKLITQEQYEEMIGQLGLKRYNDEQKINQKLIEEDAKTKRDLRLQAISYYNDLGGIVRNANTEILNSLQGIAGINVYKMLQVNAWNQGLNEITVNFSNTMLKLGDISVKMQDESLSATEKMALNAERNKLIFQSVGDALTSTFSTISQVMSLNSQRVIDGYEKQRTAMEDFYAAETDRINNSRMSAGRRQRALDNLEDQRAAKQKEIAAKIEEQQKKAAKSQLSLQLIQSIGATALGVTQALSLGPLGLVMAPIIGALGAIQIGLIASQLGKFANGGIVGGNSTSGDTQLARVNSREMILNQQQQANLFAMANGRGSGQPLSVDMSINIEGSASPETVNAINSSRAKSLKELENMLVDLKYNGRLNYVLR